MITVLVSADQNRLWFPHFYCNCSALVSATTVIVLHWFPQQVYAYGSGFRKIHVLTENLLWFPHLYCNAPVSATGLCIKIGGNLFAPVSAPTYKDHASGFRNSGFHFRKAPHFRNFGATILSMVLTRYDHSWMN